MESTISINATTILLSRHWKKSLAFRVRAHTADAPFLRTSARRTPYQTAHRRSRCCISTSVFSLMLQPTRSISRPPAPWLSVPARSARSTLQDARRLFAADSAPRTAGIASRCLEMHIIIANGVTWGADPLLTSTLCAGGGDFFKRQPKPCRFYVGSPASNALSSWSDDRAQNGTRDLVSNFRMPSRDGPPDVKGVLPTFNSITQRIG